jgi:GDP-4-dehydro-6-deoxy-D-mannose reductase
MKALITGSRGFVGGYLRRELEQHGYAVIGIDIAPDDQTIATDICSPQQMREVIRDLQPEVIFHLAGQANVALSWKIPQRTFELNVLGMINLLEAVRLEKPDAKVIGIGSSDQYGNLGEAGKNVTEEMQMRPQTPYAISKKTQEELALIYCRAYGMKICMTRSFNHAGAGQKTGFLIPDFASGIARVESGRAERLSVGNLTSKRDFTHVRDVVRAYRLLAEMGKSGEVYNIGSQIIYSAQEILDKLCALAKCEIPVYPDPAKIRPSDTPVICCNHSKLKRDTGWMPEISMDDILAEVLDEWRKKTQDGAKEQQ